MNNQIRNRIEEVMNSLTACSKESYPKSQVLEELLNLQEQMVKVVFNDEHAKNANLRIWDVIKHIQNLNEQKGIIEDSQINEITECCKYIGNRICAEITGISGEKKAFYCLKNIICKKFLIQNVELSKEGINTEIDDIVITEKGIYIIEVKNTSKDVKIDSAGNYYRKIYGTDGNDYQLKYNMAEKMTYKEILLKELMEEEGIHTNVSSILVFTNNGMEIINEYPHIRHCLLGQLSHLIEDDSTPKSLTYEQMQNIYNLINSKRCYEDYPFEIDIQEFKSKFAHILANLEYGEKPILHQISTNEENMPKGIKIREKKLFDKPVCAIAGVVAGFFIGALCCRK